LPEALLAGTENSFITTIIISLNIHCQRLWLSSRLIQNLSTDFEKNA